MSKKDILYISGVHVISNKGFFNTRISDIIRVANLSTGTFYNYFKDKNDLLFNIFIDINNRFLRLFKSVSIINISSTSKIELIIDGIFKEWSLNLDVFNIYKAESYNLSRILDEDTIKKINAIDYNSIFESIILDGQRSSEFKLINSTFIILITYSLVAESVISSTNNITHKVNIEEVKEFILTTIKA
ncbi:MAG: TetR/AcrR family transcriptional regulator [Clostridium sp.]